MVIPDATRQTRSWSVTLLRLDGLACVVIAIVGIAMVSSIWAGNSSAALSHYRHALELLAEENSQLRSITSDQEARLVEMATEAARLAERIAHLQRVADEIREIVPVADLDTLDVPDTAAAHQGVAPVATEGLNSELAVGPELDSAVLSGMGGGEWGSGKLESWLQGSLATLDVVVERHGQLLAQLKSSAEEYEHRLRHTPNAWPVTGRVTSEYGMRRHPISGADQIHAGIDIAVPTGTPVEATAAGKVIHAGPNGGYGITVVIDHGYGIRTLYAHNSRVTVQVGDKVERGDVIALAGSTGVSTGPHVHYEVHLDERPVNPREFLPR